MSKLKHLHFVQSLEPLQGGGLGAAALQLHSALLAQGRASVLFSTCATQPVQARAGVREFARTGPERMFFSRGLRAAARSEIDDITVVHGHGFYVYPNMAVGQSARRRRIPLVYHPHGMFDPWILRRSRWKKRAAHWLFENANFRHARLWRALTSKEADQIRGQGLSAPVIVLPNGIDPTQYRPRESGTAKRERTLLFLGRIHPKKGIDLLLNAWVRLSRERVDWQLCLAGPDEGGYARTVLARIAADGLAGSISMPGTLVGPEKLAALQNADGFVLTSYSEGLPMAVLEAMACGVPVVITDECNLPEVAPAGAGWTCSADEDSVCGALRALFAASDDERVQRGAAGRRLVEGHFQWSTIAAELNAACEKFT